MTKSTNYFFLTPSADNLDFIDFGLSYGTITTVGESVQFSGTSRVDSLFVRPGLTYDLTITNSGVDKIYLTGNLADYTAQVNGLNLTLSRTVGGLNEVVTVAAGNTNNYDALIFANGTVKTNELFVATQNASTQPTPNSSETSLAPQGAAATGAPLNAVLNAYAVGTATLDTPGETFASTKPGVSFTVVGGDGIDTVYVASGETVDATALGRSVDLIYLRGNWADYTKSTLASGTQLLLTRVVNGTTESVTVTTGTINTHDKLIFADCLLYTSPSPRD